GFKVYDMASGKPANNVSLGQLTTGKYYVGRAHGGQVVMSVPQWQFQEESNGRSSLSVTLSDTGEHFYYSADELSKAGVLSVENTSFSLTDSTGNVIPGTLAINSSSPNVVV